MCIFHKWLPWSPFAEGSANGHKRQFRACRRCGIIQSRSIGYADGVTAQAANAVILATTPPNQPAEGER